MDDVDWEGVIRQDGPAAWRTAYRILGNVDDADDCVQDALASAIRIARIGEVHNFRALLLRLAASRAIDRLRRLRRRPPVGPQDLDSFADPAPGPPIDVQRRELLEKLREAIGSLPARQAQVFVLCCVEDWSHEQIARELSMSPGAVAMSLLRARKQLRELLVDHWRQARRGGPWTKQR